jgi:Zn-dependent M32 family carboxypeptidase
MNEKKLNQLKELIYEINDIKMAAAVLSWDQETYMPKEFRTERNSFRL